MKAIFVPVYRPVKDRTVPVSVPRNIPFRHQAATIRAKHVHDLADLVHALDHPVLAIEPSTSFRSRNTPTDSNFRAAVEILLVNPEQDIYRRITSLVSVKVDRRLPGRVRRVTELYNLVTDSRDVPPLELRFWDHYLVV